MAIAETIHAAPHTGLAEEFAAMATRLCRSTVQVRGRGPGGGSGVIWRPDGVIVTNAHVAHGPRARVELSDGRVLEAEVTARDERRDLAALQAEAQDLPAAGIGDSDALRVGQLVLAVGNPLGLVGALTTGIVHTVGKAEGHGEGRWVQADVRLAPGNSGGPLTDAAGRVIGINSAIYGGLALAVPSNAVERFLHSRGQRPYLGVITRPVLVPFQGQRMPGLLVLEVEQDKPAERAGLMTGDVLIGVDGRPFTRPDDLAAALYDGEFGRALRLELLRGGHRLTCDVTAAQTGTAEAEAA